MTVYPGTPEGRRRTRRGLVVFAGTIVALAVQGVFLVAALRDPGQPGLWVLWVIVLLLLAAGFIIESRREGRRRRQ